MAKYKFNGILFQLIKKAESGTSADIDFIMQYLHSGSTLEETRFVDYALSLVENQDGVSRIEFYLFNGSLIQRNYCSLFFNRRGDWPIVKEAFHKGLIDEVQAFAR